MATPRKQYPSDHRRWFRVMEDILDDPGYRNLSAQDKVAWIDLLATFNRQQAHRTGNMIVLPWSRALSVLASQNRRAALARASRVAREVSAHFSQVPEGLLCYIPNYAKTQGMTPTRLRCVSVATPATTPTPTPTPTPKEKYTEPPSGKSDLKDNGKEPKHPEAMRLAELLRDEIAARIDHWTPPRSLRAWETDFDRMLRLDGPARAGIPPPEIERVIRWVVRDDFEQKNVQSASKLRKRFGALSAKARPNGYDRDIEAHKRKLKTDPPPPAVEDLDPNNLPQWAEMLMGHDD